MFRRCFGKGAEKMSKLTVYQNGFRSLLLSQTRAFSSSRRGNESKSPFVITIEKTNDDHPSSSSAPVVWPSDNSLGCLANNDQRLPLPGHVGLFPLTAGINPHRRVSPSQSPNTAIRMSIDGDNNNPSISTAAGKSLKISITIPREMQQQVTAAAAVASAVGFASAASSTLSTVEERRLMTLRQGLQQHGLIDQSHMGEEHLDEIMRCISALDMLECVAQPCPRLVRNDLASLFPDRDIRGGGALTVVTLSQKTNHDMSGWSEEMEQERDQLTESFILAADFICDRLRDHGFWADFIDPSSGRPYHGAYTNSTFFETDERYRHLGFRIEDLGCCKVISHHLWGRNAFVGCLFTNASADNRQLKQVLETCLDTIHERGPAATPNGETEGVDGGGVREGVVEGLGVVGGGEGAASAAGDNESSALINKKTNRNEN